MDISWAKNSLRQTFSMFIGFGSVFTANFYHFSNFCKTVKRPESLGFS